MKKKMVAVLLGVSMMAALAAGCGDKDTDAVQTPQEQASDSNTEQDEADAQGQTDNDSTGEATEDTQEAQENTEQQQSDTKSDETGDDAEQQGAAQADMDGFADILDAIHSAAPGTAGSSLKSLAAAADLLDWVMVSGNSGADAQITEAATEWAKAQLADGDTEEDLLDALASVQSQALLLQAAPDSMETQLEDADIKLGHDDYSDADVSGACDAIRVGIQAAK